MGVTIAEIQKLRKLTGAGLADVKKALVEAEGDIDRAIELVRERGLAIAAKRSDRETSNGCVLVKVQDNFGAMIALKCETDFVANGKDYIQLTQDILDAAVSAKAKSLEEVQELTLANGRKVAEAVAERSGITGEKMELDGYNYLEGENIYTYNHQNINVLCTMVQTNKPAEAQGHAVTMQVAAMNPVALDEAGVPQKVKRRRIKGCYCRRLVKSKQLKGKNLPDAMLQQIAQGRLKKFYKENCLLEQEFIQDSKLSVAEYLHQTDKELTVTAFRRFTLRAE